VSAEKQDLCLSLATYLNVPPDKISGIKIIRQSLDSRRRNHPCWKFNLQFGYTGDLHHRSISKVDLKKTEKSETEEEQLVLPKHIGIIGSGPAGMFAGLGLARKGYKVQVLEQGSRIQKRAGDIHLFEKENVFNPYSNILFGEGGAGAFSDGKLTCRNINQYTREVLDILVQCGAPESIRYFARPHLGSDRLPRIIARLRKAAEEKGVVFHYDTRITEFEIMNHKVTGLRHDGKRLYFEMVILAAGHSSRPLMKQLFQQEVVMEPKGFAVGVRVEHRQDLINANQLGDRVDIKHIGNAEYFLTLKKDPVRAYSFCMCPGGMVVPCADNSEGICTNGMSKHKRDGEFGNSAIVVPVEPEDCLSLPSNGMSGPFCGVEYQEYLEKLGFEMGGRDFGFPVQTISSYLTGRTDKRLPVTSFPKKIRPADFNQMFPQKINDSLRSAMIAFDDKIHGFIDNGLMIGPETRTSSPVRILRDAKTMESATVQGLFPLGEGSGYSGGIVSSAAEGLRLAAKAKTVT
jgi:uncharacterized FAD-dependent dehydrogenase